jgi:two-component system chemotaxis response regulator CheY
MSATPPPVRPRIAIIDDDADWLATVALALRPLGLAEPLLVQDLPAAWDLLAELQPVLVLIDLLMPRCEPVTVLGRLRTLVPAARIVVLSGQGDTELAAHCRVAGADSYLRKNGRLPLTERLRAEWQACQDPGDAGRPGNPFAHLARLPPLGTVHGQVIQEALTRTAGNQAAAARLLGVTPQALSQWLKRNRVAPSP